MVTYLCRNLQEPSEGDVNLRPNVNAEKFITFVENVRRDPQKYVKCLKNDDLITIKETKLRSDSQYQTVSVRKISQQENIISQNSVEEILKKITAPKSFLYRNQQKKQERALTSYVPMDAGGSSRKSRKFFRLSSYEYPFFDLKSTFSKVENCNDRGYYSVKTENKLYVKKNKIAECRPRQKSFNASEDLNEKVQDDHFYEDLCYNEVSTKEITLKQNQGHVRPCIVKIQELFQSLRFPFFKKTVETVEKEQPLYKDVVNERSGNIYENSSTDMYDSIHVERDIDDVNEKEKHKVIYFSSMLYTFYNWV